MMMRTLAAVAMLISVGACASPGAPTGGPPDAEPPVLLRVVPDSGSVNVQLRAAQFVFDEVVSERPRGRETLEDMFLISPVSGDVRVDWNRRSLAVRPREGWRPNTTYTITMLPGMVDLRNNALDSGAVAVFSTGPVLDAMSITGRAYDWLAGRVAPRAVVEAVSLPDSLIHLTVADSSGSFTFANLPAGQYIVRGFVDANRNFLLDPRELWDSLSVSLADSATVELLTAVRDTVPPRITAAVARDSVTIRVTFDRALHPDQPIDATRFAVIAPDSSPVPLLRAIPFRVWEEQRAAAAAPDTPPVVSPGVEPDTTPRAPTPSRPAPVSEVMLEVALPLRPETQYRIDARGMRGLLGPSDTTRRVFTTPRPRDPDVPPPMDTTSTTFPPPTGQPPTVPPPSGPPVSAPPPPATPPLAPHRR